MLSMDTMCLVVLEVCGSHVSSFIHSPKISIDIVVIVVKHKRAEVNLDPAPSLLLILVLSLRILTI